MRRTLLFTALFIVGLSSIGSLRAQSAVSGPTEGFTFDPPTRSIRAVIGSLGSAWLGPAVVNDLDFASVAPRQAYGIAFRRGQFLLVSQLGSGQSSVTTLPGSLLAPDGVVWSDDGSVAVLYSQAENWIQAFTGFPTSINPGPVVSISPLGGTLSAIATDLHGQHIAVGVTGDRAGVYEITSGQGFFPLLNNPNLVGLTFSEDGGTLYALDGTANQVFELSVSGVNLVSIQSWPLGTQDAIAIKAARNASNLGVLYVAGRGDRLLLAFDRSTHQQLTSIPLSVSPTAIQPLGSASFLLGTRNSNAEPLWSFINGSQPMVYFVPATPFPQSSGISREVRPR